MEIKDNFSIKEILQRFPKGFAVTPSGKVHEIVESFQNPEQAAMIRPPRDDSRAWGFLVVATPLTLNGDEKFAAPSRISVEDFYKLYRNEIINSEEEAIKQALNINKRGVGLDQKWTVAYKEREQGGYMLVLTT